MCKYLFPQLYDLIISDTADWQCCTKTIQVEWCYHECWEIIARAASCNYFTCMNVIKLCDKYDFAFICYGGRVTAHLTPHTPTKTFSKIFSYPPISLRKVWIWMVKANTPCGYHRPWVWARLGIGGSIELPRWMMLVGSWGVSWRLQLSPSGR